MVPQEPAELFSNIQHNSGLFLERVTSPEKQVLGSQTRVPGIGTRRQQGKGPGGLRLPEKALGHVWHPILGVLGQGLRQGECVSPAAHEGHVRDIAQTKGASHEYCGAEGAGEVHRGPGLAVPVW